MPLHAVLFSAYSAGLPRDSCGKRALADSEVAGGPAHVDPLSVALRAIYWKAERFGNDINVKAEEAGCNWADRH